MDNKFFNSDGVLTTPPDYIGTVIFPDVHLNILDDSLVMAVIRDPTNFSSYLNNLQLRDVSNIPCDDEFQFDICRMRGIDSLSDSNNYATFLSDKLGALKTSLVRLNSPTPPPDTSSDPTGTTTKG